MSAGEVRQPPPDLLDQLHTALQLEEYGATVRVTLSKGLAFREGELLSQVQARCELQTVTDAGRSKWTKLGLPMVPPDGQGLPELLELLAEVARGNVR